MTKTIFTIFGIICLVLLFLILVAALMGSYPAFLIVQKTSFYFLVLSIGISLLDYSVRGNGVWSWERLFQRIEPLPSILFFCSLVSGWWWVALFSSLITLLDFKRSEVAPWYVLIYFHYSSLVGLRRSDSAILLPQFGQELFNWFSFCSHLSLAFYFRNRADFPCILRNFAYNGTMEKDKRVNPPMTSP